MKVPDFVPKCVAFVGVRVKRLVHMGNTGLAKQVQVTNQIIKLRANH